MGKMGRVGEFIFLVAQKRWKPGSEHILRFYSLYEAAATHASVLHAYGGPTASAAAAAAQVKKPDTPFSHMWRPHFSHVSKNNCFEQKQERIPTPLFSPYVATPFLPDVQK